MSEFIRLTNGQIALTTRRSTVEGCPLIKRALDLGVGDIFLDLEDAALRALLEVCRNGEQYPIGAQVRSAVEAAFDETVERTLELDYLPLTIDVGGVKFQASKRTLQRSTYFEAQLTRWTSASKSDLGFYDRDPLAFGHILRRLREPNYVIPAHYQYELLYWGLVGAGCAVQVFSNGTTELPRLDLFKELGDSRKSTSSVYLTDSPQITHWKTYYRRHTEFRREPRLVHGSRKDQIFRFQLNHLDGDLLYAPWLVIEVDCGWDPDDPRGVAQLVRQAQLLPVGLGKDRFCPTLDGWWTRFSCPKEFIQRLHEPIPGRANCFAIPLLFPYHHPGYAFPLLCCSAKIKVIMSAEFDGSVSLLYDAIALESEERARFATVDHEYVLPGPQRSDTTLIEGTMQEIKLGWYEGCIYTAIVMVQHPSSPVTAEGALLIGGQPMALFNELLQATSPWPRPQRDQMAFYRIEIALEPEKTQPSGNLGCKANALSLKIQTSVPGCYVTIWLFGVCSVFSIQAQTPRMVTVVTGPLNPLPPVMQPFMAPPAPVVPPFLVPPAANVTN